MKFEVCIWSVRSWESVPRSGTLKASQSFMLSQWRNELDQQRSRTGKTWEGDRWKLSMVHWLLVLAKCEAEDWKLKEAGSVWQMLFLSSRIQWSLVKYGPFTSILCLCCHFAAQFFLHRKIRTSCDMPESPCVNPFPRERKWPAKIRQRHGDAPDIAP